MNTSHDALLDAIEIAMFVLPEVPGQVAHLPIPGIRGRMTPGSDMYSNLVGASTLGTSQIDSAIIRVCDTFIGQRKEFGWIIGPRSTPADLDVRLSQAGLEDALNLAGMVQTDLSPIPSNPAVRIRPATAADLEPASRLLAPALHISPEGAHAITEALLLSPDPIRRWLYLAFVEDTDEPVGYASMVEIPGQPIVTLFCAATLEAYQGRGIYTSLVARRLADARQAGAQAAIIQAVRNMSAPICRKLGFVEVCGLDWYAWFPE